jgi:choline/glycine/proline betaine transport protein
MSDDKAAQNTDDTHAAGWLQLDVHPYVFFESAGVIIGFAVLTLIFEANIDDLFSIVQTSISKYAGWFFVAMMNLILVHMVSLLLGRFGGIRIGGEGARPEFSTPAWDAMLFSAGMGIGLLCYGVAEPMFHFVA